MGIMILNASPRAPRSNSLKLAEIFSEKCKDKTEYYNISKNNHIEICKKIEQFTNVLFVFPLYADSLPVTLLNFLKTLELNSPKIKPIFSVLINCGFIEYEQNDNAVKIFELYCKQNGYTFGSVLKIGSGEAILSTPFKIIVERKVKLLAKSIENGKYKILNVTLPISKKMFIKASTKYWCDYGKKYGITKEEMDTMRIEND